MNTIMNSNIDIKLSEGELEGTEATISQWLISVGENINKGQPLVELETDKVSMEICAPETGILEKIFIQTGEKVETESLLGTLNTQISTNEPSIVNPENDSNKESGKSLLSPAVRRLLKENNLDIDETINSIDGSGKNGRVNRNDVVAYLETVISNPTKQVLQSQLVPHSTMRKSIASHMVSSLLETSPHVTSIFEMDMGNIIEHRKWHKKEFLAENVNLTFTAYFLKAMAEAVSLVPEVNARFHQEALELFSQVNIGVGTALGNSGLVVPVVNDVQSLSLFQIAKCLNEQTEKARTNKLIPADMKNGTLTISNHGVSGSLIATPIIINQPQVAILGVGKMEKRPVVIEVNGDDVISIRSKCYVSLTIDHRALDAHQTNLYLSEFVNIIENWGM